MNEGFLLGKIKVNKEIDLSTFVSVTGTTNEQIQKATGLPDLSALMEKMETRASVVKTDILVPNQCNQKCPGCFYEHDGVCPLKKINQETINQVDELIEILSKIDKNPYLYPREATTNTSLKILPEYKKVGMKSILTNGKTLTNPKVITALKDAEINDLTITVPGLAESYAIYTGEPIDQYEKILDGIKTAIENGFKVSTFMPIFEKNIYDVIPTVDVLSKLGVSSVNFIRVIPVGNARNLPDDFFIKKESITPFLSQVNQARLQYKSMKLSLFGQSFGPNFFSPGVWKYLAGQSNEWPGTKYMCPAINQSYLGVILGTNEIVACFEGMCFDDQKIGIINKDGKVIIDTNNTDRSEDVLREKLKGSCSKDECPYQSLCLGGCRTAAMAEAMRRGEPEPEFAGQTICITQILSEKFGL